MDLDPLSVSSMNTCACSTFICIWFISTVNQDKQAVQHLLLMGFIVRPYSDPKASATSHITTDQCRLSMRTDLTSKALIQRRKLISNTFFLLDWKNSHNFRLVFFLSRQLNGNMAMYLLWHTYDACITSAQRAQILAGFPRRVEKKTA